MTKKQKKKLKDLEKYRDKKFSKAAGKEESEKKGFPEDADFKRFLGCGG